MLVGTGRSLMLQCVGELYYCSRSLAGLKCHLQPALLLALKLFSLYILESGNGTYVSDNFICFSFSFTIFSLRMCSSSYEDVISLSVCWYSGC